MKKFANEVQQLERSVAFLMDADDMKKSLNSNDAILHLSKALSYLEHAGLESHSSLVKSIIKRAQTIDESNIEVSL